MVLLHKRYITILISVLFLLLIPMIAMQFSDQVDWSFLDFLVMGCLLFSVGLIGDWVRRKVNNSKYRVAIYLAILIAFLLIWAELAVGIFGTPFAGN